MSEEYEWNYVTGRPGIGLMGNAVQVWSCLQGGDTSVAEAAKAFNTDPMEIIAAVEHHAWMFLSGPDDDYTRLIIEHDGE